MSLLLLVSRFVASMPESRDQSIPLSPVYSEEAIDTSRSLLFAKMSEQDDDLKGDTDHWLS